MPELNRRLLRRDAWCIFTSRSRQRTEHIVHSALPHFRRPRPSRLGQEARPRPAGRVRGIVYRVMSHGREARCAGEPLMSVIRCQSSYKTTACWLKPIYAQVRRRQALDERARVRWHGCCSPASPDCAGVTLVIAIAAVLPKWLQEICHGGSSFSDRRPIGGSLAT